MAGVATLAFSALLALKPSLLASRFPEVQGAALRVASSLAMAFFLTAVGVLTWRSLAHARVHLQIALTLAVYLALSSFLWDWMIDDAAITFAYSDNLSRGHGLVLHPNHAPEEAYSNTLWMLILSGLGLLGADIAMAAKSLGTLIGALVPAAAVWTLTRVIGRPLGGAAFTATLLASFSSAYVIWAASGLEHGLQAGLFVAYVLSCTEKQLPLFRLGTLGALLILVRPEAPLLVAAATAVLAWEIYRETERLRAVAQIWPVALVPALTLLALFVFRMLYFGDPLPNPYYAKLSTHSPLGLGNPFGSGWQYVFSWLGSSGAYFFLLPVAGLSMRTAPRPIRMATALLVGQLAFVLYAGGDWMSQWRFLAAPSVLFAMLVGYSVETALPSDMRVKYAAIGFAVCTVSLARLMVEFRAAPTTPYAVVSRIGSEFAALGRRLDIPEPLLAHHDAGGTSYQAQIELLDLAGLGSRTIAKHLQDSEFMVQYVVHEQRPDFVFGTDNFAARTTRFHETDDFRSAYAPLHFEGKTYMQSDLSYIRRDVVHAAPGIDVERRGDEIVAVRVRANERTR